LQERPGFAYDPRHQGEDYMKWMVLPFRRYFDFAGRSRRKEYWLFLLFVYGTFFGMAILGSAFSAPPSGGTPPADSAGSPFEAAAGALIGLLFLASIIPSFAVQVRRFHDQDKSGWFILLGLIPLVGGILTLVFMCTDGTAGPNRFGPDPKGRIDVDVFS
jgi:uncharacterized membrane protein YhaH (DUF805 family)